MYNGGIRVGGVRGESHSVTSGDTAEGAPPRVLNLERESCEHLRWIHLEQVQHCTGLPPPGHISSVHRAGKYWARVGMNVTAHQEKKKNEETNTGKRRGKAGNRF